MIEQISIGAADRQRLGPLVRDRNTQQKWLGGPDPAVGRSGPGRVKLALRRCGLKIVDGGSESCWTGTFGAGRLLHEAAAALLQNERRRIEPGGPRSKKLAPWGSDRTGRFILDAAHSRQGAAFNSTAKMAF